MSLPDWTRATQATRYSEIFSHCVQKEEHLAKRAEVTRLAENEAVSVPALAGTVPRTSFGPGVHTPPSTPKRAFVRKAAGGRVGAGDTLQVLGPVRSVGAFKASVTAAPGTGYLPKPNHYEPGVEPLLGSRPNRLRKGDYPKGYQFARRIGANPTMMWVGNESQHKKHPREYPAEPPCLTGTGHTRSKSAGCLVGRPALEDVDGVDAVQAEAATPPGDVVDSLGFARMDCFGVRPYDGPKLLAEDARKQERERVMTQTQREYGASSYFLATKRTNATSWLKDWQGGKQPDGGRSFYWGC